MVVQDLMIPGVREWDVELIQGLFDDRHVEEIVKIPLHRADVVDTRIWNYTANGQYSVKSGYRVVVDILCGGGYKVHGDWKRIRALTVPPKIKHFLWRAARDCIPTRFNLSRRGISAPITYILYDKEYENGWHIFVNCPYVNNCWSEVSLGSFIDRKALNVECFSHWIFLMLKEFDTFMAAKFVAIFWNIWRHRNAKLWSNNFMNACSAVFTAMKLVGD